MPIATPWGTLEDNTPADHLRENRNIIASFVEQKNHCIRLCIERGKDPASLASMRAQIAIVDARQQAAEEALQHVSPNNPSAEEVHTISELSSAIFRAMQHLIELTTLIPEDPDYDGISAVTQLSDTLVTHERVVVAGLRASPDATYLADEGLEERRELCACYGTDDLFRSYLGYGRNLLKFSQSSNKQWQSIPGGVTDARNAPFLYKREEDLALLSWSPNNGLQEFALDTGFWSSRPDESLTSNLPDASYETIVAGMQPERVRVMQQNREVELILRDKHPHFNHPHRDWKDTSTVFPDITLLRRFRALSGK